MSKLTEVLKLLCYDSETDGNLTFNVTEALTKNWEKIDAWVSGIKSTLIGKASLGENGAVPVEQGGTGATTAQAALAALGAGVRPNLLDNAIFVGGGTSGKLPINQKGQTEYTGQVSTIDRWSMIGTTGKLTLSGNGAYFEKTVDATSYAGLDEKIPLGNLEGKELTLSCLVNDICYYDTVDAGWSSDFEKVIPIETDGKYMTLAVARVGDTLRIRFYYGGSVSAASTGLLLQAVKLEIGSTQTLAYQDIDGTWHLLPQPESDYATQLAKCQRYFKPISGFYIGGTAGNSGTTVSFFVPGEMRTTPSVIDVTAGDMYIQGQEIPDSIAYIGDAQFDVVPRGTGYVVKANQSISIGTSKTGKIGVDAGYFDARL